MQRYHCAKNNIILCYLMHHTQIIFSFAGLMEFSIFFHFVQMSRCYWIVSENSICNNSLFIRYVYGFALCIGLLSAIEQLFHCRETSLSVSIKRVALRFCLDFLKLVSLNSRHVCDNTQKLSIPQYHDFKNSSYFYPRSSLFYFFCIGEYQSWDSGTFLLSFSPRCKHYSRGSSCLTFWRQTSMWLRGGVQ